MVIIFDSLPLLLDGALLTIEISALSIFFGLVLGIFLGVFSSERIKWPISKKIIALYVIIIRGTPLFVQLLIIYFALPEALGIEFSPFTAGVLTLTINSSAYLSEIVRGGINGVAIGQWEASYALGYSKSQALRFIVIPQALRSILPAITNELATLIKESSILMVIGVAELLKVFRDIVARELVPIPIYFSAAILYLLMTTFVGLLSRMLERSMK